MTDPLFEALDRLVPVADVRGDWQAILEEAGRRPRRRLTRGRVLVAFAVAVVAVVSATPAFGLRDLILDLVHGRTAVSFEKSRPAPPTIKKQFLDMAIGAPAGMNPEVLPDQAREITFRRPSGQERVVWVAPTRGGGFCSFGGTSGGCISKETEKRSGAVTINGAVTSRGGRAAVIDVSGYVFSPNVSTLTLEFADGQSLQLPFVFISAPIDAGFYAYGLPSDHQEAGHWPTELVARDKRGATVGTATVRTPTTLLRPPRPFTRRPSPPQPLPAASTVTPTAPLQTASDNGITAVVGANGAVRFTARAVPAQVRRLLRGRVGFSCFRLTREFGIPTVRGFGSEGAFADSVGLMLRGVGSPFDGCEADSSRGHRWPDALGSHSPVEIAFTAKGRAYFADRAAARDLALFVRSGRMQKIRKKPGQQLLRAMKNAYGTALARSSIRYVLMPHGITFSETSSSGKVFRVVVENGRVEHSNIAPYSKVF